MSTKTKKPAAKSKKQPLLSVETSQSIADQTAAFLKSGGAIEKIASGVSGQQSMTGRRHITLTPSRNS